MPLLTDPRLTPWMMQIRIFLLVYLTKHLWGKSTINGDDGSVILPDGLDLGNKLLEYPLFENTKPIIDSRSFTTNATNHALKTVLISSGKKCIRCHL